VVRPVLVLIAVLAVIARASFADPPQTIALLPLDAEAALEIYGQPTAGEIAKALGAGGMDVAVIGAKAAVPERARLIIDGTIASKGENVVLSVRIRDRATGAVLDTVTVSEFARGDIERAIGELANRVGPAAKAQLVAVSTQRHVDRHPVTIAPLPPARLVSAITGSHEYDPLKTALLTAVTDLAAAHHRTLSSVEDTPKAVSAAREGHDRQAPDVGLELDVWSYDVEPSGVMTARAKVHAVFMDCTGVTWERTVVTDTVVGERGKPEELAARTAREILEIVLAHVKRTLDPQTSCVPKAAAR
jgi:hypothetical protein